MSDYDPHDSPDLERRVHASKYGSYKPSVGKQAAPEQRCAPCPGDPRGTGFCEFHECERDCQTAEPNGKQEDAATPFEQAISVLEWASKGDWEHAMDCVKEALSLLKTATLKPPTEPSRCTCKHMHGHEGCVAAVDVACGCVMHDNDPQPTEPSRTPLQVVMDCDLCDCTRAAGEGGCVCKCHKPTEPQEETASMNPRLTAFKEYRSTKPEPQEEPACKCLDGFVDPRCPFYHSGPQVGELPRRGNDTKAVSDIKDSMKVVDRFAWRMEVRLDVLDKYLSELIHLREQISSQTLVHIRERDALREQLATERASHKVTLEREAATTKRYDDKLSLLKGEK